MYLTLDEARAEARVLVSKLHHYIQPNQSGDPLLTTPFYEADVNLVAAALVDARANGMRDVAQCLEGIEDLVDAALNG
jgi:hypothetical protein